MLTFRPSPTSTGSLTNVKKRSSVGARRRKKSEKREALSNYRKMMREPGEEDWAKTLSGSRKNEGRSRRRKEWIARKKSGDQKKVKDTESIVTFEKGKIEKERKELEKKVLAQRMDSQRLQRIEELSSAKV